MSLSGISICMVRQPNFTNFNEAISRLNNELFPKGPTSWKMLWHKLTTSYITKQLKLLHNSKTLECHLHLKRRNCPNCLLTVQCTRKNSSPIFCKSLSYKTLNSNNFCYKVEFSKFCLFWAQERGNFLYETQINISLLEETISFWTLKELTEFGNVEINLLLIRILFTECFPEFRPVNLTHTFFLLKLDPFSHFILIWYIPQILSELINTKKLLSHLWKFEIYK